MKLDLKRTVGLGSRSQVDALIFLRMSSILLSALADFALV